ncbi:MAG: tripartite tricarboxylate transporter substrate binding protein [Firmicutes bacterium]|nr:tripartite tricarboxylate transporter substrate binding protein [Bacillota bacterium]
MWRVKTIGALLLGLLLGLAVFSPALWAADYPKKPITYIIPFNPGGQSDLEARRQQPLLEKILGVSVVITYKAGGGGSVGWTELVNSPPDGYTIAGNNIPHIILQPLQRENAGYQTADLEPVALFQTTPIGLAVLKSAPFKTLGEFIAYAKENPGAITVAGSGTYTGHHLAYLQFQKLTNTKLTYVPFTGAAPQVTAFLGGHTMAIFGNSNDLVQHKDRIRILAIGSEERFAALPEVPTFKELGLDMTPSIDRGVCVPTGTPPERIKVLEKAFLTIAKDPEIQEKMISQGFVPKALGAEEFRAYIARKTDEYIEILKELGIE